MWRSPLRIPIQGYAYGFPVVQRAVAASLLCCREREVLPLLASGLLNKQVAFELGITEWTVQLHRGHIMRKMQADSFAGLVRMADKLCPSHQQHLQV